jgi:hypothetical protein
MKSENQFFRFLELFTESLGWLRIAASPTLIGAILASIIYFSNPDETRLTIAIIVFLIGMLVGVYWATKHWKGKGTVRFLSRTLATPELQNLDEENS